MMIHAHSEENALGYSRETRTSLYTAHIVYSCGCNNELWGYGTFNVSIIIPIFDEPCWVLVE